MLHITNRYTNIRLSHNNHNFRNNTKNNDSLLIKIFQLSAFDTMYEENDYSKNKQPAELSTICHNKITTSTTS